MEKALEDAKQMMQQLMPASLLGDVVSNREGKRTCEGRKRSKRSNGWAGMRITYGKIIADE